MAITAGTAGVPVRCTDGLDALVPVRSPTQEGTYCVVSRATDGTDVAIEVDPVSEDDKYAVPTRCTDGLDALVWFPHVGGGDGEDCTHCDVTPPAQYQAVISGITNCDYCESITPAFPDPNRSAKLIAVPSGTFTLTQQAAFGLEDAYCVWHYTTDNDPTNYRVRWYTNNDCTGTQTNKDWDWWVRIIRRAHQWICLVGGRGHLFTNVLCLFEATSSSGCNVEIEFTNDYELADCNTAGGTECSGEVAAYGGTVTVTPV